MSNGTAPTTTTTAPHRNVVPSEVGWQFVPQYYTYVNKYPNRLHCFYTKNSTFVHGTEGEDGAPCYGQQEIHSRIQEIAFEDCKVFIHSVDAQSSANGGIIIQVIGEMSNKGETWRKFVQTFFLAEQPNGYFVLNDIFRFLKEETVEDGQDDEIEEPAAAADASAPVPDVVEPAPAAPAAEPPVPVEEPTTTPAAPISPSPSPSPAPPAAVEEPPKTHIPEPVAATPPRSPTPPAANGVEEPAVPEAEPEPAPVAEPEPEPVAAPPPAAPPAAAPTPAAAPAAAPPPAAAAPPPAQPAAPPVRKTWANLAAAGANKWGSAVAQESRGTSEAVVSAPTPPPQHQQPRANGPGPNGSGHGPNGAGPRGGAGPGGPGGEYHGGPQGLQAAQNISTPATFVKGVVDPLTNTELQNVLTTRFGPTKEFEVVRSKACAFVEFTSLDAARKAIVASLPQSMGGEGGVRIDTGNGVVRISVETRKERGERPPAGRGRGGGGQGGGPQGGSGGERGGFQQRGRGGQQRGRGAPAGGK